MEKALLEKSINDWRELYLSQLVKLYPRNIELDLPTYQVALGLIGIRRCGKTSLAIEASKKLNPNKVFYYNFEDPLFDSRATTFDVDQLIATAAEYATDKIELLILDEIHNVALWEKWLRKLIDLQRYRIIITGSSAKIIQSELSTSLTGRTITKQIWPLSLTEFHGFHVSSGLEPIPSKLLRDYLTYGGFPAVTLIHDSLGKKDLLNSYFNDILLKDVIARNEIRNANNLRNLATFLFTNLSSLHSSISIERALGIDRETALTYIGYLLDAFLICRCSLFTNNLKVQQRTPTKYYLGDLGLRLVGARSVTSDDGKLLENLVYLELRRRNGEIYFSLQEDGEVDFIVTDSYKPVTAYQSAFTIRDPKTRSREVSSLISAARLYDISQLYIVTWDEEETIEVENYKIAVIPVAKFCSR